MIRTTSRARAAQAVGCAAIGSVLFVSTALASPVDPQTGILSVQFDSFASMRLGMFNGTGGEASINAGGQVAVHRGNQFTDLGRSIVGGANTRVQGAWDEQVMSADRNLLRAIWKTNDGTQLIPAGAQLPGGSLAQFWSWNFGTADPVDFHDWVSQIRIDTARVYFSLDGGQTFSQVPSINIKPSLPRPGDDWTGADPGTTLPGSYIGIGINYIKTEYVYEVIPAPGAMSAFAVAGLVLTRRRR
jgi:hypothetical protein